MTPTIPDERALPAEPLTEDYKTKLERRMWVTRGSRFTASERLLTKNSLSAYAIGMLSTYLIMLSLFTAYRLEAQLPFSNVAISFMSTSVSILVLLFSQLEFANDYKVRAGKYLQCGLEISKLYNHFKLITSVNVPQGQAVVVEVQKIVHEYETLLTNYENHETVDFNYFRARNYKEFRLTFTEALYYRTLYTISSSFVYYLLMFGPPILFVALIYLWPHGHTAAPVPAGAPQ